MNEEKILNLGFDPEKEDQDRDDEKDWVFGAEAEELRGIGENISYKERYKYLPKGEVQRGVEDFMDCATRGPLNKLKQKFNFLYQTNLMLDENKFWLKENGYINEAGEVELSDRFNAIISGTTRRGNSMKAPLESIRKYGAIPKSLLPKEPNMTWAQYHDRSKITDKMYALGKEFIKRFPINYERVYINDVSRLLEKDLLILAGYAWPRRNSEGEYVRTESTPNHVFVGIQPKTFIFDNYEEDPGDFIKKLAENYKLYPYGYRVILNEVAVEPPKSNNNEDMIKTIKFATEPKIYLVDNNDHLKITWLGGLEGENTWNWFKEAGWVSGDFEVVDDSLKPLYKIEGGIVKVSYEKDSLQGGVQGFLQRLFNKLKK